MFRGAFVAVICIFVVSMVTASLHEKRATTEDDSSIKLRQEYLQALEAQIEVLMSKLSKLVLSWR